MLTLDQFHHPHLPLSEFMLILPGVDKKFVRNATDRELLRWTLPRRGYEGPRLYSLFNALEAIVLDRLSKTGSRLPVAKMVAGAAASRFEHRINQRTLGTDRDIKFMIYEASTTRDNAGKEEHQLARWFVSADEIVGHLPGGGGLRLQDNAAIETRIIAVDDVIEDLFRLFTMARRDGRVGATATVHA